MKNTFKKVLISTLVLIPTSGMPVFASDIPEAMVEEEAAQTFTLLDGKTVNSMIPNDVTKVVFGFAENAEGDLLSVEEAGIFGYRDGDTYFIVSAGTIVVNDPSFLFEGKEHIETIRFENFDTAEAKTLESMFSGCATLKEIDLSGMDIKAVENSKDMFKGCKSLHKLIVGDAWIFTEDCGLEGNWIEEEGSTPKAYIRAADPITVETTSDTTAEAKAEAESKPAPAPAAETNKAETVPENTENHATLVETESNKTSVKVQSGLLSSSPKTTTTTTKTSNSGSETKSDSKDAKATTLKEADARKTMQETAKAFKNVIKRLSKMLEE